ncbi:phosphoribosyltransferase family protein [Calycomorphotria hydatis]|uniref:DNA utilization protein GntX n=1 Tax=Calycomorphotria hydatis TaxID=2528027 RepID=A0A517TCL6_9PLAN|nr:phosphoribosyltransferase family protein [Calycomorphotria hydatis]QDT66113.1 DNA utilization protein GntX [Calycomorphotria hydatis]
MSADGLHQQLRTMFHTTCGGLLDSIATPCCPVCSIELPREQSNSPSVIRACHRCEKLIEPISESCPRCGAPVGPHAANEQGCHHCHKDRLQFDRAFALGLYQNELRKLCLAGKQQNGTGTLDWLAERLYQAHAETFSSEPYDIITAVPQHWTTRLRRRHNSAEVIAEHLSTRLKTRFAPHILSKVRWSAHQRHLSPTARRKNLRHCFAAIRSKPLYQSRVLLCDDVMTTGTTASECARSLRDAGAKTIDVAVIARGVGQTTDEDRQHNST